MTVVNISDGVPGTAPVLMLNMLKFADRRLYLESYLPAFARVKKLLGMEGEVSLAGNV